MAILVTRGIAESRACQLSVQILHPDGRLPQRQTPYSAGYDIYAAEGIVIPAADQALVGTGIAIQMPSYTNIYGQIAPRSSLAVKHRIHVGAGVIDADYRGEVKVLLVNMHPTEAFHVKKGMRIAQLVLKPITFVECVAVETLEDTSRGTGGFGSTGV